MGWSEKYKKSIDCDNPKGFSQRAHCQGRKKKMNEAKEKDHEVSMAKTQVKKSIDNLQKVARVLAKKTDADNLPAWVQAKLTDTEHNTDAAASYMEEGKRDGKSAKDKDYSLRDWFAGGGWVQAGGKYDGKPCAKQPGQKTKPFCRDADDRAAMSKEERNKRAKKKRKEDPNPNRKGKAKIVREQIGVPIPPGKDGLKKVMEPLMKQHGGGKLIEPSPTKSANIRNAHFKLQGELIDEKKDACYKKVKARYDVWPSAYASGALVKCRKVGAANWGNKTKNESYDYSNWRDDFKALEIETIDLIKPEPLVSEQSAYDPKYPIGKEVGNNQLPSNLSKKPRFKRATPNQSSYTDGIVSTDAFTEAKDPCWDGYKQVGMKKKGKKMVPNCVKEGYSNWREELGEDWQKVNRQDKTDGLSQKAVDAYRRENPGSKLQTAVTEKKPTGKRAKRRANFCRRMKGMKSKLTSAKTARDPDSRINKALRRWNCN